MQTYSAALKEYADWLASLTKDGTVCVRKYLVREGNDVWVQRDLESVFSDVQVDEILTRYKLLVEKEEWLKQAERQVFVADAVKELRKAKPVERAVKNVAVTICPQEGTLVSVKQCIALALPLSCMKEGGTYVFEQRSETAPASGWHIHMNVKTTYPPSKVKQYLEQKIRKNVSCYIVVKPADEKWATLYMQGIKKDLTKDGKAAYDKIVRPLEGLQELYTF